MILSLGFEQQEQGNLIDMDDGPNQQQRMNTQILIEEDDTIQQLQERERSIRQLEVTIDFYCDSFIYLKQWMQSNNNFCIFVV